MSRSRRGRVAALVAAIAFTGGIAGGQTQPVQTLPEATATANRLLQSSDAKEVAWGAFTAAQYQLTSTIPLLVTALQREFPADADPHAGSKVAILDALVQLHARVPAEVLRSFLPRWPIPTLILLDTSTGDRDGMLLERLGVTGSFEWQAVANLLLQDKPPGFAFRLLDGLQLRLTVYVSDEPNRGFGSATGGGSEHGCMAGSVARGYPPLADYAFAVAGPGATILSVGPNVAYYVRRVLTPPTIPCDHTGDIAEKPSGFDRVRYLNALVKPSEIPLRDSTDATVLWSTPEQFQQDVSWQRKVVADQYRTTLALLESAKRLTEDEAAALAPHVTTTVRDVRTNKSEPLPELSDRGAGRGAGTPRRDRW